MDIAQQLQEVIEETVSTVDFTTVGPEMLKDIDCALTDEQIVMLSERLLDRFTITPK